MKRELRKQILKRDQRICKVCEKEGAGQVHHIIPLSKGGKNTPDNLITLCGRCHLLISPLPSSLLKRVLHMDSIQIEKAKKEVLHRLQNYEPSGCHKIT